jgi:pimeloyl-CoA synthetase
MITETIGKHKIQLYNSIDELTAERFSCYNKMMLIDSGIGSSMQDVDSHISKALRFIESDKKSEAAQELINMRTSFYFIIDNISPKYMSYAALIYSIDGKPVTDFSEDNLRKILDQLNAWGTQKSILDKALEVVKKKFKLS